MMQSHPPISLSDHQMAIVTQAARSLPIEKRSTFLERVAGTLSRPEARNYRHPTDGDVNDAVAQALISLLARVA
jgi:hypothetical protein